ncbi:MAG: YdeI/OmpD-associated family protein [Myxococcota bacterium]
MSTARTFTFHSRLERVAQGAFYAIAIPARVSQALGKRGNVPVVAEINGVAEVRASLVPAGGGRHRLRLNASTRMSAAIEVGDRVHVRLRADLAPALEEMPADLRRELRQEGALEAFERMPVGRQRHIVEWIEKAAHEVTREKRIAQAVEVSLAFGERLSERANYVGGSGKLPPLDDRMRPRKTATRPRIRRPAPPQPRRRD